MPTSIPVPTSTPEPTPTLGVHSHGREDVLPLRHRLQGGAGDCQEVKDAAEPFVYVASGQAVSSLLDPGAQECTNVLIAATQKYLDNSEGMLAAYTEMLALDAGVERCEEVGE